VYAVPAPVATITQTNADSDGFTIQWTASGSGLDDVRYVVRITDAGRTTMKNEKAYSTSYTVSGLNAASLYYVQVGAYNYDDGTGDNYSNCAWSGEIMVATGFSGSVQNVKQIGATTSTATITWDTVNGADGYSIYKGTEIVATTNTNQVEVPNLSAAAGRTTLKVVAFKQGSTYKAESSSTSGYYSNSSSSTVSVAVLPSAIKVSEFNVKDFWPNLKQMKFERTVPTGADGVQIQVYTIKGAVVYTSDNLSDVLNLTGSISNHSFKYRARPYIILNDQKCYGAWSGYRYFAPMSTVKNTEGKFIKLKWKKVAGAKSYTVYIQKLGATTYTKAVTTKKIKCTIKKLNKKKIGSDTYNVKIVPNIKVGKKTKASDATVITTSVVY
jgi:hypothetical protein